jgi:hypothetical protein
MLESIQIEQNSPSKNLLNWFILVALLIAGLTSLLPWWRTGKGSISVFWIALYLWIAANAGLEILFRRKWNTVWLTSEGIRIHHYLWRWREIPWARANAAYWSSPDGYGRLYFLERRDGSPEKTKTLASFDVPDEQRDAIAAMIATRVSIVDEPRKRFPW